MPGVLGNPGGRPRTQGLSKALRAAMDEFDDKGRTVEQQIVAVLIDEALKGRHRLPAILAIFDRLEGRPRQSVEMSGVPDDVKDKSMEEVDFYLEHYRWPTAGELAQYKEKLAQSGRPTFVTRAIYPDEAP